MRGRLFLASAATATTLTGAADASEIEVIVEIREHLIAEYHKPYVAIWVAHPDHTVAANLALWYQQGKGPKGEPGEKWLKDIRRWWRKEGNKVSAAGVTGPTKPAGRYRVQFNDVDGPLKDLPHGDYVLHVEAAREKGERELIRIPFEWTDKGAASLAVKGEVELGYVTVTVTPW